MGVVCAIMLFLSCCFFAILYAVYIPDAIKRKFNAETGFYLDAENIFVNLLNGTIEVRNVLVFSPDEYKEKQFIDIDSMHLEINPRSLLLSELYIYKADIKVRNIKCIRIAASKFNLRQLLSYAPEYITFAPKENFKGMSIEIDSLEYDDISDSSMEMKWSTKNKAKLFLDDMNALSSKKTYIKESFEKADAAFMTTVLRLNE